MPLVMRITIQDSWDVSGVTRLSLIFIKKYDVCMGGDWNTRGCECFCDSTSSEIREWTPIACALILLGDMPEDSMHPPMHLFCGKQLLCSSVSVLMIFFQKWS